MIICAISSVHFSSATAFSFQSLSSSSFNVLLEGDGNDNPGAKSQGMKRKPDMTREEAAAVDSFGGDYDAVVRDSEHKKAKGNFSHDVSRTNGIWQRSTVLTNIG